MAGDVVMPASGLVIAVRGSSESRPLLLSLNKQLQQSPRVVQNTEGAPMEKLRVAQTTNSKALRSLVSGNGYTPPPAQ